MWLLDELQIKVENYFLILWKIWAMNTWGNQNLNIMFYYARKKNEFNYIT